jgi:hypothetical protein
MTDKVLVIPATFKVGAEFPPYLPLPAGEVKPTPECSKSEVASAVEELKGVARQSRERLEQAYADHVRDVETLAQISAYLARFEQWDAVRSGGNVRETLWHVDDEAY